MSRFLLVFLVFIIFTFSVAAVPKIKINHKRGADNKAQIQIKNETNRYLKCYVAIDGHRKHFTLDPFRTSKWFKATHVDFNSSHFSTWCDFK